MYALIKSSGMFIGIFSSKENMKLVIEALIKNSYQKNGYYGNYGFRYAKINVNEPWITNNDNKDTSDEALAILSLSTMHTEYFKHCVKTNWSTGEILDMDSSETVSIDSDNLKNIINKN